MLTEKEIKQLLDKGEGTRIEFKQARLNSNQVGEQKLNILKNIPLNSEFKELTDTDLLAVQLAKSWEKKSRELDKLRFLIINNIQIDKVRKAGSWEEKSGELLKKRGKTILGILILTLEPASLEELTKTLGYKDKDRFRDDYIKPLRDNGLLQYTIPEKPNDPNQAYLITQRGKDFLGGHRI